LDPIDIFFHFVCNTILFLTSVHNLRLNCQRVKATPHPATDSLTHFGAVMPQSVPASLITILELGHCARHTYSVSATAGR